MLAKFHLQQVFPFFLLCFSANGKFVLVFFLKAWVLRTSSFRRRDIGALPHFSWPCTQSYQWRFGCIFSCRYLSETTLWNAWWAPVVFSIAKVNMLFNVELIFAFDVLSSFKVVSFGWGLHCLQVWCATLYWVSVFILETRKAIKTFLIFFSLFCRHVSGPLYHFISKSFANVSLNILFFWFSYMLGIFYWHY